jgi:transposase
VARPARYPEEFRREAIALVRSSERPVAEVARSLGIAEGTLWNWVRADRANEQRDAAPDALNETERAELKRLRKLTAQQAVDLEILRKAAAYFAKETNR